MACQLLRGSPKRGCALRGRFGGTGALRGSFSGTFSMRPGKAPPVPPGVLTPGAAPVPGNAARDAGVTGAASGAGTGVSAARHAPPR